MANLIPEINPDEIENSAERLFAKALVQQLPSRVQVFHGIKWVSKNRYGKLREGESDFVILDPNRGLLFIEVKGGEVEPKDTKWVRHKGEGHYEIMQNPVEQVIKSMHELIDRICQNLKCSKNEFPGIYGYAIAIPESRLVGQASASLENDIIIDADKCRDLKQSIQKAFDRWEHKQLDRMNQAEIEAVYQALYPKFEIIPVLWRKIEDQEKRLNRLTSEQSSILEFLSNHNTALIQGIAGSGKTILALSKAQETAGKGLRTLFLCYNRPLKDWLESASSDSFKQNLHFETYHSLVASFCKAADIPFHPNNSDHFWNEQAPTLLMDAAERLDESHKFDAVIVDEGQDFRSLWWDSLESIFRNPDDKGCYYVFYDPLQNIYLDGDQIPKEFGKPFKLSINCRNTQQIASHCSQLVNQPMPVSNDAPIGDKPEMFTVTSIQEAIAKLKEKVRSWYISSNLEPKQIAILVEPALLEQIPDTIGNVVLSTNHDLWRLNKTILKESWKKFKGLEADAIVLIEIKQTRTPDSIAKNYVARSRAKHLLTIIEVDGV